MSQMTEHDKKRLDGTGISPGSAGSSAGLGATPPGGATNPARPNVRRAPRSADQPTAVIQAIEDPIAAVPPSGGGPTNSSRKWKMGSGGVAVMLLIAAIVFISTRGSEPAADEAPASDTQTRSTIVKDTEPVVTTPPAADAAPEAQVNVSPANEPGPNSDPANKPSGQPSGDPAPDAGNPTGPPQGDPVETDTPVDGAETAPDESGSVAAESFTALTCEVSNWSRELLEAHGVELNRANYNVIRGTDGPDVLNGTDGPDLIYGGGGVDEINAGLGGDWVFDQGRGYVNLGGPSTGEGAVDSDVYCNTTSRSGANVVGYDVPDLIGHVNNAVPADNPNWDQLYRPGG